MDLADNLPVIPKTWNPQEYYQDYKSKIWWIQELIDSEHEIFGKLDPIPNSSILDFGCGPIITNVISASRVYDDIYMSDYGVECLEEIRKWLKKDTCSIDFLYEFEQAAEKEGSTADYVENRVRNSIKDVISCDIHQKDPLLGNNCPRAFDAVISSDALGVACTTLQEYKEGIKKLAALLKPGGMLVINEDFQQHYWVYEGQKYHVLPLVEGNVREAVDEAGLKIERGRTLSDNG